MLRKSIKFFLLLVIIAVPAYLLVNNQAPDHAPLIAGAPLDSLDGVVVYHNVGMDNVSGRNVVDGYNVGLKYLCVEFVKPYYL